MKYDIHPSLFLRAPFYSFRDYDLHHLPEVLQRREFRLAVKLASTVFYKVLQKKGFLYDLLSEKEIHTLHKYYNRMSFRATPFGYFATVSALPWMATKEDIRLANDSDVFVAVTSDWASTQAQTQENNQRLFLNPLLYRLGPSWRYIATNADQNGSYNFSLQELDAVRLNNELFKKVKREILPEALADWVAGQTETETGEAADYIRYLTDEQVLVKDPGRYLIEPAGGLKGPSRAVEVVSLRETVRDHQLESGYSLLSRPLISGGPNIDIQLKLADAIQNLSYISGAAADPDLVTFIGAFVRRFDRQRVPLLEALDPDAGIAYGGGSLKVDDDWDSAGLTILPPLLQKPTGGWSAFQRLLFSLWKPVPESQVSQAIRITKTQLQDIQENLGTPPSTLSVLFRTTTAGLALDGISGASATQLIGRFSLLNEDAFLQGKAMATHEISSNPDVVFADISHRSDERVDNINRRKQLYPFELCLNTVSALPQESQICPDDLLLSVRKGELILESKRLKKRIIPRLSTAYNFKRSGLPIFNLLCALQYQGLKAIGLPRLDQLFPELVAYPRLYLEDVIVSPSKWIFRKIQLQSLALELQNETEKRLADFRLQWSLPALIALGDTDQQLVFDLLDPLDAACFLKEIAGKEVITIREYLKSDKTIRAGSVPVAGQYLAYFKNPETVYEAAEMTTHIGSQGKRSFQPGSEWLYLQVFCTPQSAARILLDIVAPVIERMRSIIKTWFFIRYDEDGNHLRLRFKLNPADQVRILTGLNSRLRNTGLQSLVQNMRAETYRPELERYPFFLMSKIENVFQAGSDLILRLAGVESTGDVLMTGLITARMMMQHYRYDLSYMLRLSTKVNEAFITEMGDTKQLRLDLDKLFRSRRAEIDQVLSEKCLFGAADLWHPLGSAVASLAGDPGLSKAGKDRLITDLIHMQLNRTFSEHQRLQEMTVWYCLCKYLKGFQARSVGGLVQDREDESSSGLIFSKNASR